jgi:hypothetical protein
MLRLELRREGCCASLVMSNVAPLEFQAALQHPPLGKKQVEAEVVLWAQELNCCSPVECSRPLRRHNRSGTSSNTPGTRLGLSQRMNRNTGKGVGPWGRCLRRQNRRVAQHRQALRTRRWSMQHPHLWHLRPQQRRSSQTGHFLPDLQSHGRRLLPTTQGHLPFHSAISAIASERNIDRVMRPYSGTRRKAHAETSS